MKSQSEIEMENELILFMTPDELEQYSKAEQGLEQALQESDLGVREALERQEVTVLIWLNMIAGLRKRYRQLCQYDKGFEKVGEDAYVKAVTQLDPILRTWRALANKEGWEHLEQIDAFEMDTEGLRQRAQEASTLGQDDLALILGAIAKKRSE